eukprot:TRINITY_DN33604_c0_g1_i2.p1 TRINITY_DN33604_c0_g1~~TRINITY_DN33604_c0_g1_i2.p1  ORF type:complete len:374 (-),score=46.52 TRINITY_DN33604_c0_g1_i2:65-1186(-)
MKRPATMRATSARHKKTKVKGGKAVWPGSCRTPRAVPLLKLTKQVERRTVDYVLKGTRREGKIVKEYECPDCGRQFRNLGWFKRHRDQRQSDPTICSRKADRTLRKEIGMWLRPGTTDVNAFNEVFHKHTYEKWHKGFRIEDAAVWLDLGAQKGDFTCLALAKGCKVVAVEAHPANFELLEANIKAQAGTNPSCPVTIYHAACVSAGFRNREGDAAGRVCLNEHPSERDTYRHSVIKHVLDKSKGGQKKGVWAYKPMKEPIPAYTVEEILLEHPDIEGIKIDIEGEEMEMLEELVLQDCWCGVRRLTFEYSHEFDDSGPRFRKLLRNLRKHFLHVRASTQTGYSGNRITIPTSYGLVVYASKDVISDFSGEAD